MATLPDMTPSFMNIPTQPDCPIAYKYQTINSGSDESPILIVFVNGLMMPMAGWVPSINLLKEKLSTAPYQSSIPQVSVLTYDRYAQGQSQPNSPATIHDLPSAATDLYHILQNIISQHYSTQNPPQILCISQSIGVPIARLYSTNHEHSPFLPSAHLFLDSNIANTDFTDIYPDPDAADFDPSSLPADATVDALRQQRAKTRAMFHPAVPNAEKLDRSTVPQLLPHSSQPKLVGMGGKAPFLTVVGHDPQAFAEEGFKMTGSPKGLSTTFMSPFWAKYNEGLLELTSPERRTKEGVVIAKGASHFIQKDNPDWVAEEALALVVRLAKDN